MLYGIIGPPGCGKTTYICEKAEEAARKFGSDKVLIASMTRAASANVKMRLGPKSGINVGTLHSHCARAIGNPDIMAKEDYELFNSQNPDIAIPPSDNDVSSYNDQWESTGAERYPAKEIHARYEIMRSMMDTKFDPRTERFHQRYTEFKRKNCKFDFTDLLEFCVAKNLYPETNPAVIYGDECQDWSKLEFCVINQWASKATGTALVGDPDQTIYDWRGADPGLLSGIDQSRIKVLGQSYRVPAAIHAVSQRWIRTISDRIDAAYQPTPEEGSFSRSPLSLGESVGKLREKITADAERGTVMVLATCAYMLNPLVKALREAGTPFWNPYRPTRGDWNPISTRGTVTAADRIAAFCAPLSGAGPTGEKRFWTNRELWTWLEMLSADGVLKRGAKSKMEKWLNESNEHELALFEDYCDMFESREMAIEFCNAAMSSDFNFLKNFVIQSKRGAMEYPATVFRKHGYPGIFDKPKIIIGTIHSVKGGEADKVYLFPDISPSLMPSNALSENYLTRLFYVGMTRAKKDLIIGDHYAPNWFTKLARF